MTTKEIRWYVYRRDNYRCAKCGRNYNLTLDHIIPKSLGGEFHIFNLQTLCKKCNGRKSNTIALYTKSEEVISNFKYPNSSKGNKVNVYNYYRGKERQPTGKVYAVRYF